MLRVETLPPMPGPFFNPLTFPRGSLGEMGRRDGIDGMSAVSPTPVPLPSELHQFQLR